MNGIGKTALAMALCLVFGGCDPCLGKSGAELEACKAEANDQGTGGGAGVFAKAVADEDFEGAADVDGWVVDNTVGQGSSKRSVQPPVLDELATASLSFSCSGKAHSLLTFWRQGAPGASGLRFYVDDKLYETYGSTSDNGVNSPWIEVDIAVQNGTHDYRWEVTTDKAGRPPFHLDSFRCVDNPQQASGTETVVPVDFDDGFVPPEISGDWLVNNSSAQGPDDLLSLSTQPPILDELATASLSFSCGGKPHSFLTFWRQAAPGASGLRFYVDDKLYETYGSTSDNGVNSPWVKVDIAVQNGTHDYRWEVTTDKAGRPPFHLDSFRCVDNPQQASGTETVVPVDFDDGFVPPEISGDWLVNNSSAQSPGDMLALSTEPPILDESATASLSFSCGGKAHSLLTFWRKGAPGASGLRFYVDDKLYETYGSTSNNGVNSPWIEVDIAVQNGTHDYRWEVTTDKAGRPPFHLDSFRCVDNPQKASGTDTVVPVDFDDGFVPPEISGDWLVNNSSAQSPDDMLALSTEPPILDELATASLSFACGDKAHSLLTFWRQGAPGASGLRFYVDNKLYETYGSTSDNGVNSPWVEVDIAVQNGTHDYRWEVTAAKAGRPPFHLDSFRCE